MDVLSLVRLVVRHWRLTIPAALLTVIGAVGTLRLSPPTYESTGSVVLLSPPDAPRTDAAGSVPEVGQNPFARYGDLSVVADIVVRVIGGDSKRADLASQGVTGYDVVANRFQRGPVVDVTGKGSSEEAAIASAETVLEDINTTLTELQDSENADPDYYITAEQIEPPSMATAMYGSSVRTAIAALAVGGLGTLALAVLAEALSRRRAVRPVSVDGAVVPGTADPSTEPGLSDHSGRADWSDVPSAPPSQDREPPRGEPASRSEAPAKSSVRQQRWQMTASKRSSRWPADNGHKRPTSDRSP